MSRAKLETVPLSDAKTELVGAYARVVRRRFLLVAALAGATLLALLLDLNTGPASLSLLDLWSVLAAPAQSDQTVAVIMWQVRLPAAIMAVLVGAALALAGAEMQTILNNPLASPFTLGVSAAASLGAGVAIVAGVGLSFLPAELFVVANAFLFAVGATLLLQLMARGRRTGTDKLVLLGIALVFTFNALTAVLHFVASPDATQQLVFWGMGSLSRSSWFSVCALAIVLAVALPFALGASWRMTALRLGEERAKSFGVDVARLRFMSLLRVSLLAATSVAFVGTIGFVGLVGPHIARLLIGEDHRFLLPASALSGALVMSLAAAASKTLAPGVILPVGLVTALVGLPAFFALILRERA